MIVDKQNGQVISGNQTNTVASQSSDIQEIHETLQQVPDGGIIDVVKAIKEILSNVRWEYGNPESKKIFQTVQWDDGQYERIVRKGANMEYELAFPAAFVHFVDTKYLVSQQRIGEGRAKLRIHFILNRLNVHDEEGELDPLYVAQRIDQEITEHKVEYECLSERCQLIYWDFPLSFDYGLQPGWLTYEVWFREKSIWIKRRKTYRHIVMPPFTNHSDQSDEANEYHHTDDDHLVRFDGTTSFVNAVNQSQPTESDGSE